MAQEREIDETKSAAEDANEQLDKALAEKNESGIKLQKAKDSLCAAQEKSQQMLAKLTEVKAQVKEAETEAADGPGGSVFAIVEALRGEIAKKVKQLEERNVVADQLRDDRAAMNEELSTAQRGRLMVMNEIKQVRSYADLAEEKAFLSEDYAIALEEVKDIREGKVEFGGNEGVLNLAEQLEEVQKALEEEAVLMKDQEQDHIIEYKVHRDTLQSKTSTEITPADKILIDKATAETTEMNKVLMTKQNELRDTKGDKGQLIEIERLNKELSEAQRLYLTLKEELRDLKLTNKRLLDELQILEA